MKKLLLIICCLSLAACNGVDSSRFQIVLFNNHTYIAYDGGNFDSGLVHDPDCRCQTK